MIKKNCISIFIILLVVLLGGCDDSSVKVSDPSNNPDLSIRVVKYDYEGHQYIGHIIRYKTGYRPIVGVTHNPDCPCQNKEGK